MKLDPDELAHLEDQRTFLLASLTDLEREHDAGDLEDDDFVTLRDDYTARAAETIRAIDEQRSAFAQARRPRSTKRTVLTVAGVVVFALVAGLVAADVVGPRQAGSSASGGINVQESPSQKAQQCIPKLSSDPTGTISCFRSVLTEDPRNVVALTWLGWTLELVSSSTSGTEATQLQSTAADFVERAVAADPNYSYARAFRAVIAYRHGQFAKAKQYLADFEARNPSSDAQSVIDSMGLAARIEQGLKGSGG